MLVAFRVDASLKIGSGHVVRCITLADRLRGLGHQCIFITRRHPGHLGEMIAAKNFELHFLPRPEAETQCVEQSNTAHADWLGVSWQEDAKETLKILKPVYADWLIVDHYALDERWEREISGSVGRVMVIDDLADRGHNCTLFLDQNLGRASEDYDQLLSPSCIRLIGPRYAMLRPEFSQLREKSLRRRENPEIKRVLISFGGVDPDNVTGKVLRALLGAGLSPDVMLDIVVGAASPHLRDIQHQADALHVASDVNVNVSNMAERMQLADLSIGAAGGTSWERCCMGLPAILVVLADNQVAGASALEKSGAAVVIPEAELVQDRLPALFRQLCEPEVARRMSSCAAAVTLGDGANRVAQMLTELGRVHDDRA